MCRYISFSEYLLTDVLHLDPGLAPASEDISIFMDENYPPPIFFAAGTPEAGGWTVREVKRIIRGLAGLNFV